MSAASVQASRVGVEAIDDAAVRLAGHRYRAVWRSRR